MKTKAVNIYKEKCEVYCGRGKGLKNKPTNCKVGESGWLGNPVSIGINCPVCKEIHKDGGSTLPCYELYLKKRLEEPEFRTELYKLEGNILGCFCKPKPCHVDIIIKIIEEKNKN
jgi:hypothetical protein